MPRLAYVPSECGYCNRPLPINCYYRGEVPYCDGFCAGLALDEREIPSPIYTRFILWLKGLVA